MKIGDRVIVRDTLNGDYEAEVVDTDIEETLMLQVSTGAKTFWIPEDECDLAPESPAACIVNPDYDYLFNQFLVQARDSVAVILRERDLRSFQQYTYSLNVALQAAGSAEDIVRLREVTSEVNRAILEALDGEADCEP